MPAVTLSPATPNVTLTGLTSAYGTIGSYYINAYPGPPDETAPVEAAIFGTAGTNFNILATGTILSPGTSQFDAGIVLGGVGAVKNTGTIIAPAGIFILGSGSGAYAGNLGTIIATKGDGIDMLGNGGVNNSGLIIAASAGIFDNVGLVENFGTIISGETGIFQRGGTGINNGTIIATASSTGVVTYGTFTNSSSAAITAPGTYGIGIFGINYSEIYNDGKISAHFGVGLDTESSFYNSGVITASHIGIYEGRNLDLYADGPAFITNYAGGAIKGKDSGIRIHFASANIYNYGLISGTTAVSDDGIILNAGTIKGQDIGVFLYEGILTNTGSITARTGILSHQIKYNASYIAGRTINNQGKITGQTGIRTAGGTVFNAGHIEAHANAGIELTAAGQVDNGVYVTSTLTNAGTLIGTIIAAGAGISLARGGTVTNTGTISSGADGVDLSAKSALYNTNAVTSRYTGRDQIDTNHYGTIIGARYGVSLAGAGYIYNNRGFIYGASAAIYMRGVSAASSAPGHYTYLYDHGTLTGTKYGVLSRYGTIDIVTYNDAHITGQIAILAASAYLNLGFGYVGGGTAGIVLTQGGTIHNAAIIGARGAGSDAVYVGAAGGAYIGIGELTAENGIVFAGRGYVFAGDIQGFSIGVDLKSGGTIVNTDRIYGPDAITMNGGGTVINQSFGVITGDILFGAGANRLILDPTSVIQGVYASIGGRTRTTPTINLDGGILELAAGKTTIGTLLAFEEGGASAITIDKAANWSFAAGQTFTAPITNDGTIRQISGAGATIAAAITGNGEIAITAGTITLDGAVGPDQKVKFLSPGEGELALGDPAHFAATIQNFGLHETIDLTSLALAEVQNLSFSGGVLTLTETQGRLTFTFANPAHFANETFSAFADGPGTGITLSPAAPAKIQNSQGWLNNNLIPSATNAVNLITLQT